MLNRIVNNLINPNPAFFLRVLKNIYEKNLYKDLNPCDFGYFKAF